MLASHESQNVPQGNNKFLGTRNHLRGNAAPALNWLINLPEHQAHDTTQESTAGHASLYLLNRQQITTKPVDTKDCSGKHVLRPTLYPSSLFTKARVWHTQHNPKLHYGSREGPEVEYLGEDTD